MEKSFPVRGAITHGEVSWQDKLIYGGAVIEAHALERSLEWIGIACGSLPAVPWSWDVTCCYPVPKKPGKYVQLSPAIIWDIPQASDFLKHFLSGGLLSGGEIITWEKISKFKNALIFSRYVDHAKQAKLTPDRFHSQVPSHISLEQ